MKWEISHQEFTIPRPGYIPRAWSTGLRWSLQPVLGGADDDPRTIPPEGFRLAGQNSTETCLMSSATGVYEEVIYSTSSLGSSGIRRVPHAKRQTDNITKGERTALQLPIGGGNRAPCVLWQTPGTILNQLWFIINPLALHWIGSRNLDINANVRA
jgi:hypothetical protein